MSSLFNLLLVSIFACTCTVGAGEVGDVAGDSQCLGGTSNSNSCSDCLDAAAFAKRVAAANQDPSIITTLRGTVPDVASQEDISALLGSLPDFVEATGYGDDHDSMGKDARAYNAPVSYAGLNLRQLCTSHRNRYETLLRIRETARESTERALGLCPGTLLVDYTTISQKTNGGAHRPHADNCLHVFDPDTNRAECSPEKHPYPKRVAASILYLNDPADGNFDGGEFYFAKRDDGGKVDVKVPVERGKMVYFTAGLECMHGALPVQFRGRACGTGDEDNRPRRFALAMWYVTDPDLEEYVPPFRDSGEDANISQTRAGKPRRVHDPNDPAEPKALFEIPIPDAVPIENMFQSIGRLLARRSTQGQQMWQVNKYAEDILHVLFKDHSGMFSLDFGVDLDGMTSSYARTSVLVERHTDGRKPASLQYMLQESVMLHQVLDGLSEFILGHVSDEEEESYFLAEIEKARGSLPARPKS